MNTSKELTKIASSLPFRQAQKQLQDEIQDLLFESDLGFYSSARKLNTFENPFPLDRIGMTEEWLEKHLSETDKQKLIRFKEINEHYEVILYREEENPNGAYLPFEFMFPVNYEESTFDFLIHFGDTSIQEKYRLAALFAKDGNLPDGAVDDEEFFQDIQDIGQQIAVELSDTITELLAPLHQQILARIKAFKLAFYDTQTKDLDLEPNQRTI